MATDDKLTTDAVINQVLIEEKSRKASSTHSALTVKMTGRSKQKGKGKVSKEDKGKGQALTAQRAAIPMTNGGRRMPLPAPRRKMTRRRGKQKRRN